MPIRDGDFPLHRNFELQQRDVGGSAMRQHLSHLEAGMDGDSLDVLQLRHLVRAILQYLVDGAGLDAMRDRQHQGRRDQAAGAEVAARADNGDDGAADAVTRRRRRASDDRLGGREQQQRGGR